MDQQAPNGAADYMVQPGGGGDMPSASDVIMAQNGGAGSKGIVEGLAKGVGVPCHIVVKPYHSAQWVRFEYGTKFCSVWPAAPFQGPGWPARSHRQGSGHRWPCCRHYI